MWSPDRGGPRRPSGIDPYGDLIMGSLEDEPDMTLLKIAARLDEKVGYRPPSSVVQDFFKRRGVTRKRRRRMPASRTGRT